MTQVNLNRNIKTIEQIREILNNQRSFVQKQSIVACIDLPPIEPMETEDFLNKQIQYSSDDKIFCVYWIQWHKIDGSRLIVSTFPNHEELFVPNYQKYIESQWFKRDEDKLIPLMKCCICGGAEGSCPHTSILNMEPFQATQENKESIAESMIKQKQPIRYKNIRDRVIDDIHKEEDKRCGLTDEELEDFYYYDTRDMDV